MRFCLWRKPVLSQGRKGRRESVESTQPSSHEGANPAVCLSVRLIDFGVALMLDVQPCNRFDKTCMFSAERISNRLSCDASCVRNPRLSDKRPPSCPSNTRFREVHSEQWCLIAARRCCVQGDGSEAAVPDF
jgi:hypothetical protein